MKSQRAGIKDAMLLELSNNTRWNILYHVLPKTSESPEASILYKVEDEKGNRAFAENLGDILIRKVLPPGKSVAFCVPAERLAKGYRTYVEFSYEWETRNPGALLTGEPNHRVYFSYFDLPATLRAVNGGAPFQGQAARRGGVVSAASARYRAYDNAHYVVVQRRCHWFLVARERASMNNYRVRSSSHAVTRPS